jgi:hypothetical protein
MSTAKIAQYWPEHADHEGSTQFSAGDGFTCACGVVLGFPVVEEPEHDEEPEPEKLSVRLKREAQEKVAAARSRLADETKAREDRGEAPRNDYTDKPVKGAFGTYSKTPVDAEVVEEPASDGLAAPDDLPYDVPIVSGVFPDDEIPPDDTVPPEDEYEIGDTVKVGGIEFTKVSDNPFPVVVAEQAIEDGDSEDVGFAPAPDGAAVNDRGNLEFEGKSYGPPPDEAQAAPPFPSTLPEEPGEPDTESTDLARRVAPTPGTGTPIVPGDEQRLDPLHSPLAPLDPTEVYTPADVEMKIVAVLQQLENSEIFLRQQLGRLHEAEHNWNLKYQMAIYKAQDKAADQRKAAAWLASQDEHYEMTQAQTLVKALQGNQHNLRSQLSGFQSVARSLGVSMGNTLGTSQRQKPEPPAPRPWEY